MLSVLLWKEYREHRIVWTVLAFISAAAVLSLSSLAAGAGLERTPMEWKAASSPSPLSAYTP